MTVDYRENQDIKRHIRMCAALSHLPPSETENGWLYIMESSPVHEGIEKFNDYFVNQWLENETIRESWICYGERHRTTNSLEAWHSRLNKTVGKAKPNIFELLAVLKEDAKHFGFIKQRSDLHLHGKKRRKIYANLDEAISSTVEDFVSEKKSLAQCLENLKYIVKFE